MPKPHPKGPRVFRNLFESISGPKPHRQVRVVVSPGDSSEPSMMSQILRDELKLKRVPSDSIDLTSFAGRFEPPSVALVAGFELPPGFSSRLNVAYPVEMSLGNASETAVTSSRS